MNKMYNYIQFKIVAIFFTRCAFVSNLKKSSATPSLLLTHKDMQTVLQKDLCMNVYRDGQWGVFRHQMLHQGTF